jgi:hypothetical protein
VRPASVAGRLLDALTICSKRCRVARAFAITADTYQQLIGTIAQKAVDQAANLIAHRSARTNRRCGSLMRTSCLAARAPPTRRNIRHAGVAQSEAQLSCKQQVRGSSPLASSLAMCRDIVHI